MHAGAVRPQIGMLDFSAAGIELTDRCFVGMQVRLLPQFFDEPVGQRLHGHADAPHSLGQCRACQRHTCSVPPKSIHQINKIFPKCTIIIRIIVLFKKPLLRIVVAGDGYAGVLKLEAGKIFPLWNEATRFFAGLAIIPDGSLIAGPAMNAAVSCAGTA